MINATKCLYIKLGEKGEFENQCIEMDSGIMLSYKQYDHQACLERNWDKVYQQCIENSKDERAAKDHLRQIKLFYESTEDTLWFTFYAGKLYWTFAESKVSRDPKTGYKLRKTIGGWKCRDVKGFDLLISGLSGKLTRTKGYRQTICETKVQDYVLRRINGQTLPSVESAKQSLSNLEDSLENLLTELSPQDFELLVEAIFSNSGWIRIGVAGKNEKDIDLELLSPVTNERVFVQIKSESDQSELEEYISRLEAWDADKFFYVYHTSKKPLKVPDQNSTDIHLVDRKVLSQMVIKSGLTKWLIDKAS